MKNAFLKKKMLPQVIAAALMAGVAGSAAANEFSLVDNQFEIKNNGTRIALAVLNDEGVLDPDGSVLPRIELDEDKLDGGLPSFSFKIKTDGLTPGSHSFKIGLSIIDDESDDRRFEAYLGELILTVSGGTVTGTIPDQPLLVRALKGTSTFFESIQNRSDNGAITIADGSTSTTLSFDGDIAVELLKDKSALIDPIISNFTLNGTFTFAVVIEENSPSSDPAEVGVTSSGVFSAVPKLSESCVASSRSEVGNVFALLMKSGLDSDKRADFSNPYAIQGRFTTRASIAETLPTKFTDSEDCGPSDVGGGGGGGIAPVVEEETDVAASESEVAELDDVLDNIADTEGPLTEAVQEQVDALNTALGTLAEELDTQADEEIAAGEVSEATVTSSTNMATKSAAATTSITKSLASGGTVSKTSLLGALTSGAKSSATASKVGKATTSTESKAALVTQNKTILTNSATMLTSLASSETELTTEEVEEVKTVARNLVSTSNSLSGSGTSTTDLKEIATQTSVVLQAQADLGIAADTTLVEAVSEASEAMATSVITQELTVDGAAPTTEQITEALTTNSTLFDNVLEASIPLPPAVIITEVERNDRIVAARPSITPEVIGAILSATKKVVRPDTVVLKSGKSALTTLLDFLRSPAIMSSPLLDSRVRNAVALTTETEITSDEATGLVTISSGTETYVGMVLGVRSVPAAVPNGIRFRTDGRATVVTEGTAIDIASNAFSLLDFIDLAQTTGFAFEQNTNASFTLDLGEGQTFVGAYAYDNLVDADLSSACGALSVIEPAGPFNAASYSYGIECASGVMQKVVPFTANTAFFSSMQASEMTVSVDRNTGIVNVSGIGKLKPSFFTAQPTEAELVYHASETDSFGIALQIIDINNDGINDSKVISATSVQIMYGLN